MFRITLISCLFAIVLFSCKNPHVMPDDVSSDPQIRARELNDSAIDLVSYSMEKYAGTAIKIFDESIRLDSTYDKARLNKFAVFIQQKSYHSALEEVKPLEKLRPWDADLQVCKGLLQEITGDNLNAVFTYELALKKYQEWRTLNDSFIPTEEDLKVREASVWYLLKENKRSKEILSTVTDSTLLANTNAMLGNRQKMLTAFWKVMVPRSKSFDTDPAE